MPVGCRFIQFARDVVGIGQVEHDLTKRRVAGIQILCELRCERLEGSVGMSMGCQRPFPNLVE